MKNNTIILGDSYSTFTDFIPNGYLSYYSEIEKPETDVTKVSQTWWAQVVNDANLNLILNNSWSGSTIGYTGYNNSDCSESSSFIFRLKELIKDNFFVKNEIHKVFVFGGTNDSWADAPLGEMKFEDWTNDDLYYVLPAICYFFNLLRESLPQSEIYCMINIGLKPEISSCLKTSSERYSITPITFDTIDKRDGHPTIEGMKNIKDTVLKILNS